MDDRTGVSAEPTPPRDSLEFQLLDLWRQLLRRDDLGVHDEFFASGGHSLLAMRLVIAVRKLFGTELTSDDLLAARTVAQLATVVRGHRPDKHGTLVRVQEGGRARPPIYALPPVSGTVLMYGPVAAAIGADQPFWAAQSLGLQPGEATFDTVEEIIADFLPHMRSVHPGGPWHLLGYSMGGVLAYEAARQLAAAGEQVGLVGLLDTRSVIDLSEDPDFALRALLLRGLRVDVDLAMARALPPEEREKLLLRKAIEAGTVPEDFDAERLRRMVDMYQHNLLALDTYRLPPYPGRVVMYRVLDHALEPEILPEDLGWRDYAAEVVIERVPGHHYTMIQPGNVEVLGAAIRRHLGEYGPW
jgi:thioesterase domain-containing protein/acyl carrier protein